ncbi:MAG: sigma-70 family RNA polymerase sigma factor [Oscillospiraceae bacterium]|nr:sigma-70 family RNA polymerase sigma factor [Oscillospiraceae bacterium]
MQGPLQRTGRSLRDLYEEHIQTVYRVAFLYVKNKPDSEDVVQDTFVQLIRQIQAGKVFDSPAHERAWLIVTASNTAKNLLRRRYRSDLDLADYPELAAPAQRRGELLDAICALPDPYKTVIYMFYYEGYSAKEIAGYLGVPAATVRTRLARARKRLKLELGGEPDA